MNAQTEKPSGCMTAFAWLAIALLLFVAVIFTINTKGIALPFILLVVYWRYSTVKKHQREDREKVIARAVVTTQANDLAIRRATYLRDLGDLTALDPTRFEQLVSYILSSRGFAQVTHCGGPGDRGADLLAIDENGRRVVVQCKRYGLNNKVGSAEIQRFVGAITIHEANRGIVVTTSTYTAEATAIAGASRVELIDGATLLGWIRETRT